jgi:uncharacterized membrane protein
MRRAFRHLISAPAARRVFPAPMLERIQHAIAAGERDHLGEICLAVEGSLSLAALLRGRSARERAHELFARLRVWDTAMDTGVLVYVLLADRAIEIVADRGIAAAVAPEAWQAICTRMQEQFKAGDYERGACDGIAAIGALLARHFPADGRDNPDELPDRPALL